MDKRIISILIFTLFIFIPILSQSNSIPIIAFMGVPANQSSDQSFKEFREAGFDICISNYNSLQEIKTALFYANKQGVKIIPRCWAILQNPLKAAQELKDYPALFGYHIFDEPDAQKIKELVPIVNKIMAVDPKHPCYINLLPYYGDGIFRITKTKNYKEYLEVASQLKTPVISFDHYPIQKNSIRQEWYQNLEMVRKESILTGKPFWGFILSTPHLDYPQPTLASLRLQAYVNLAYGAQALQYYTYWTLKPHDNLDYHNGPINYNGKKTKTYNIVQKINAELKQVGALFADAEIISVHHLLKIPIGTTKQPSMPMNLSKLSIKGTQGAVLSTFYKQGHTYLAIVNKDYQHSLKIYIQAKNDIPKHVTKSNEIEHLKSNYSITGGDLIIFRLE